MSVVFSSLPSSRRRLIGTRLR